MGAIQQVAGGRFADWFNTKRDALASAVTLAVDLAGKGAQADFRQDIGRTGYKALLANLIGEKTYPRGGTKSVAAAAAIEARGDQADLILGNFVDGRTIAAKGKHLAIPTGWNRPAGRRGAPFLVSPQQMIASRQSFVRPARTGASGVLVWFLKVTAAQSTSRGRQMQAIAGGLLKVGSNRKRTAERLKSGAVPMFILVPYAVMPRIFNAGATMQKWADAVPDLIERAMPKD